MKRKITPKQREFLNKVIVEKKTQTQAALEVYDCKDEHSAKVVGCLTMKSLDKKGIVEKEYEKFGLSKELIFKALTEDIKAKKKNRKGELELAAKLMGLLTEQKKVEHSGNLAFESLLGEIDDDTTGTSGESL